MNVIELVIWLAGIFPTVAFWSRLDGIAKSREADQSFTNHPPYIAGVLTSWAWPLQILLGGAYMTWKMFDTIGRSDGIEINEALAQHRSSVAVGDRVTKQLLSGASTEEVLKDAMKETIDALAAQGISVRTEFSQEPKKELEL